MKTTTTILIAIFALQINILSANNEGVSRNSNSNTEITSNSIVSLAPVTPAIADFEESAASSELLQLAPRTPSEASFEDSNNEDNILTVDLAPVTPAEAEFNDAPEQVTNGISLAPVTPSFADFDEVK